MIEISKLCIELGTFLLKDISLKVNAGEYFMVLGPTGAGKTILLETIAGLYPVNSGKIRVNEVDVTKLEPEKRGISIVYQDHALFPHLSAKDNITFGLRLRKDKNQHIKELLFWITGLLKITGLLNRLPLTLSGGERQKVALARALIIKPAVLLLDEPLSSLDPETRENLQEELSQIQKLLKITTIHVTHDFEEAISLGHRIAVINEGHLQQVGTPEQIFCQPNSEFVARFAMTRNIFTGEVRYNARQDTVFNTAGTDFLVDCTVSGTFHATIRPEYIQLSRKPLCQSGYNCRSGTVTRIIDKGSILYVTVNVPPDISCLITRQSFEELGLMKGERIYALFKTSSIHLFR